MYFEIGYNNMRQRYILFWAKWELKGKKTRGDEKYTNTSPDKNILEKSIATYKYLLGAGKLELFRQSFFWW